MLILPAFESSGLMITCTVLYPEQFDALRRTYDCEKSMIESLARCAKFNASGGKSGSAFLKTRGSSVVLLTCVISLKLPRRSVYRKGDLQSGVGDDGDVRTCLFRLHVVIFHCWSTFASDNLFVRSSHSCPSTSVRLSWPRSSDVSKLRGRQRHIPDRENPKSTR